MQSQREHGSFFPENKSPPNLESDIAIVLCRPLTWIAKTPEQKASGAHWQKILYQNPNQGPALMVRPWKGVFGEFFT